MTHELIAAAAALTLAALANCGFATSLPSPTAAPIAVEWRMSPMTEPCLGPADESGVWSSPDYSPPDWEIAALPVANPIPGDLPANRFFRGVFTQPADSPPVLLHWRSDDGSWIYINGALVAHQGSDCLGGGCVNMKCGNGVAIGGLIDLTPHLVPGINLIAVQVANGGCCGSYFDAALLPRAEIVTVDWKASPVEDDCAGPRDGDMAWNRLVFGDDDWTSVTMPDINPIAADRAANRFYRGLFVREPGVRYVLKWAGDDGSWVYVNGQPVGHAGGPCLGGGTGLSVADITHLLEGEVNLVALHLTNGPGCCSSLMDATVIGVRAMGDTDFSKVMMELY